MRVLEERLSNFEKMPKKTKARTNGDSCVAAVTSASDTPSDGSLADAPDAGSLADAPDDGSLANAPDAGSSVTGLATGPVGRPSVERDIISDEEAFLYIKKTSRAAYKSAWETFRASNPGVQHEFEDRVPSEKEVLDYLVGLREGKVLEDGEREDGKAASTILTTYSLLNGVLKHKYSFNLNKYPRIAARMKVWQSEDVKRKAAVFTPEELKQFCESEDLQGGYWEVRKAIVILAFFGGLRLVEAMSLQIEKISPCPEGFNVVHDRAKGRTDKPSSKFKIPKKKSPVEGEVQKPEDTFDWAACFGNYLAKVKGDLGKFQGRVFYTGRKNGGLVSLPMGRNKISEVAREVARFLGKPNPEDYSFHSFRRSAATAAADAGATAQQMVDFFGWKNQSMTAEYISTSNHQLNTMADRLATVREESGGERQRESVQQNSSEDGVDTVREESGKSSGKKREREDVSSSDSEVEESCKSSSKKKRKREDVSSDSEDEKTRKISKQRKGAKKVIIINM